MLCNDLNSSNGPYVVCWEAWNGLKTSGTPTGISTANGFECDMEVDDFDVTEGWGVFEQLLYSICDVSGS